MRILVLFWLSSYFVLHAQHTLVRLPYPVNTRTFEEICPVFNYEEQIMFYTKVACPNYNKTLLIEGEDISQKGDSIYQITLANIFSKIAGHTLIDPVSSSYNQDIYLAEMSLDNIVQFHHPNYPLNNALTNSVCSSFGKSNEFIVINIFDEKGGMIEGFSMVQLDHNFESNFPVPIVIENFDKNGQEVNLTASNDQLHLFMSMRNPETKDKDLYLSFRQGDKSYSAPMPIFSINTKYNETTPFISSDKKRLYFASDRSGGQGGLDIYYADRLDYSYQNWSLPTKFNPPLNSHYDESHPYVFKDGSKMYFNSDRDGSSDIYSVKLKRTDDNFRIKVKIKTTTEDGKAFPAEIKWGPAYKENGIDWSGYFRSKNGEHVLWLDKNEVTAFTAENRAFKAEYKFVDPQELFDQGKEEIMIHLIFINDGDESNSKDETTNFDLKVGSTTILRNIYFKQASAEIIETSMTDIKNLANVLIKNPQLVIAIEGHTDNVGNKSDLLLLSEQRAEIIKQLLVKEGAKSEAILIYGFGDLRPITDNSNEEQRQKNRRVEIRVLKN